MPEVSPSERNNFLHKYRIPVFGPFSTLEFLFDNLLVSLARELLLAKLFELVLSIDVFAVFNIASSVQFDRPVFPGRMILKLS